MNMLKRWIKTMLVLCLLITAVPMAPVFAETENPDAVNGSPVEEVIEETIDDEEIINEDQLGELSEQTLVLNPEIQLDDNNLIDDLNPDSILDNEILDDDLILDDNLIDDSNLDDIDDSDNLLNNDLGLELALDEALIDDAVLEDTLEQTSLDDQLTDTAIVTAAELPDEFIRAFALDCGRLYFSVAQIKDIIDEMALYDYTHLTLAFGNSGFRFLLDDMTIGNYASEDVKNAILVGNTYYAANDGHNNSSTPNTCLTQAEMDEIITYAISKGIEIIPALNSPGHMNTVVYAMKQLNVTEDEGYIYSVNGNEYESVSTININDDAIIAFVSELIQKYINYFAGKGCTMFNLGADEFTNDPTDQQANGAKGSFNDAMKSGFINYVNSVAEKIVTAGMVPMMFNDGYAWADANFNKNIVICYWTSSAVNSKTIANAGHKIINNSQSFYYVLGSPFGDELSNWCSYASALNGTSNVPVTQLKDGRDVGDNLIGAQMFLWCDKTDEVYTEQEAANVKTLIRTLAKNNPNYFTNLPVEPETRSVTVKVNESWSDTIVGNTYTDAIIADESKVSVQLTTIPKTETVINTTRATELEDGATYIIRLHNKEKALSTNKGSTAWTTNTLAFENNSLIDNPSHYWKLETSGNGFKIKSSKGYLNLGNDNNSAYLDENGEIFTIVSSDTGWYIGNGHGRYLNDLGGHNTTAGGWTGNGTRFDLYKVTPGTEISTNVEFTGLATGTTQVTVGHVTYNVTITDGVERREVIVAIGENSKYYMHDNSDVISQSTDESIAILNAEPGDTSVTIGEALESESALTDGKYVIYTYLGAYLTNEVTLNKLAMDEDTYTIWNIEVVDRSNGTYYIKDSNGNYLTVGNGSASVTPTPTVIKLVYGTSTDKPGQTGFFIQNENGNYNLNNSGAKQIAVGKNANDAIGSYSRWQIKSYTETPSTEKKISFTGASTGTTYATIGNVEYTVRVLDETIKETREITLHVNQTLKDVIKNANVSGNVESEDSLIATAIASSQYKESLRKVIQVTSKEDIVEGGQYLIVANQSGKALTANVYPENQNHLAMNGEATADNTNLWTITKTGVNYYFSPYGSSNQYLTFANTTAGIATNTNNATKIDLVSNNDGTWRIKNTNSNIHLTDNGNSGQHANGYSYDSTANWKIYKLVEEEASYETTVSFTGKSIGTTYAVVDRVFYTIHVEEEDLSLIYLTYHPWLSNFGVYPEGTGSDNCSSGVGVANPQQLSANLVATENGVAFKDLVWATGDWHYEGTQTHFWKGTILSEENHQEGDAVNDKCMSGIDFQYIRYWNSKWSYSIDGETWIDVLSSDEVCAYYLQETDVTTEVETFVKDWAFLPEKNYSGSTSRYQKALSISVVYPGGTMNPIEEQIYLNSTMIYWDNLEDLGFIRFAINSVYEVEKITYTFGERAIRENAPNKWDINDDIVWEKTTINNEEWFDETVCWDPSYGTEPIVDGTDLIETIYPGQEVNGAFNGSWGRDDAVLLLVYLKPIVTEDSLEVIYFDEKFGEELTRYNITVKNGHNFTHMGQVNTSNGSVSLDTNKNAPAFKDSENRIDVTGFGIVNNLDVIQRFQTDLTKVPNVRGKYKPELYVYTGSEISEDGKTLILYYNVNTEVLAPNYVIDFGLPIKFSLSDIVNEDEVEFDSIQVQGLSAHYGTLSYDDESHMFTYTPTTILKNIDVLTITLIFESRAITTTTTHVGVFPATTVHYEESFIAWDENWSTGNEPISVGLQTTEILGQKKHNFGYDPVYDNATGASNGTHATASKIGASGTFTFTGNGIQVFANCTEKTGYASVMVTNSAGKIVNVAMVDTVVKGGDSNATTGQTGNMDGLPVVSLIDLQNMSHDTYTVTIRKVMDSEPINIDGIRVFNTLADSKVFSEDLEDNPDFYELRDMVLHAVGVKEDTSVDYKTMVEQVYNKLNAEEGAALILDTNVAYANSDSLQDLLDNGPKNEIYLYKGQTLSFKITTNRVVQIGLKAPKESTSATIKTNETTVQTLNVQSSVDMFYKVLNKDLNRTDPVVITVTNTGEDILAVTLLKVCDNPDIVFEELSEADIEMILFGRDSSDVTDSEISGPVVDVPEIVYPETDTESPDTDITDDKEHELEDSNTSEGDVDSEVKPDESGEDELVEDTETENSVPEFEPEETLSFFEKLIKFICDFLASIANWIAGIFA